MKKEINDLDLGRFSERIDKSLLTLNEDGTYDYDGNLDFSKMNLKSLLEIPIRFRNVSREFWCDKNKLTSLEGSPSYVGGDFWCSFNNLINLYGAPSYVGESFSCSFNNLISLQYAPKEIGGDFWCASNQLFSKVHLSKISGKLKSGVDNNPFKITDDVIKTIKRMIIDQRIAELKFFKDNDLNAYDMMLKALNENDIGYGPKAKEMLEIVNNYDISNLV